MKTIKLILLLITCQLLTAAYAQKPLSKAKREDKILDMIAALPQVIESDEWVKKVTKGKRHLVSFIGERPSKNHKYYGVNVAEDNGVVYHNHYLFEVDPKTYAVFFYDTLTGKLIPLKTWQTKYYKAYKDMK